MSDQVIWAENNGGRPLLDVRNGAGVQGGRDLVQYATGFADIDATTAKTESHASFYNFDEAFPQTSAEGTKAYDETPGNFVGGQKFRNKGVVNLRNG